MLKRLVCLANSRKLNGRCVAGIEVAEGVRVGWIRPVSNREHEEVSEHERQYEDGSDPRVLDVIDVPMLKAAPHDYQQENWRFDPKAYWVKVGRLRWSSLASLADPVGPLWLNGYDTSSGKNDSIPLARTARLSSSLQLIHVDPLTLRVFAPGEAFGNPKRRVQGRFVHGGIPYRLWVTDPDYEREYLRKPDGNYQLGGAFLTVSLGEAYKGSCYKLIAAVIEQP